MASEDNQAPHDAGWRDLLRGGNLPRALMLAGGVALHAVSIYVVATLMPVIAGEIGGVAFFAWTATLYVAGSLCSAAAVPVLLARVGPLRAYHIAFGLFLLGSLVCSVAPNMAVLLLGRLVQGLGGGMLPALSYATIRVIFAPSLHARAIVWIGSVWGIAAVVGPFVGGVFGGMGAWRAAFWVDVVLALGFMATAGRTMPAVMEGMGAARPIPGLRLVLLALAAIAVGSGGAVGRAGPALMGILAAVVLVGAVKFLDGRASARMLPAGAFDPRVKLGAVSATMALMILAGAPGTFLPYLLHHGQGVPVIAAGYFAALYALSWTGFSLVSAGYAGARLRASIAAGPWLMAAGLLLNAWAIPEGALVWVGVAQVLLGAGIGLGWAHLAALMIQVAPASERDLAGPFVTAAQTLATIFGSALAGMVANLAGLPEAAGPGDVLAVAPWLFGALAVVPVLGGLTAWRLLRLTASR
jgi:MFS family permease